MDIMQLVERSLYYIVDHSHFVIQITIFVIVVLIVVYLFNLIVSGNTSSDRLSKKDISELETRIKAVLEQASVLTPKSESGAGDGKANSLEEGSSLDQDTGSNDILEQIQTLKQELEEKDLQLQSLKASSSTDSGLSEEESKNYIEKINALETKLQEYEIIEDEIADLSHFKEENEKLKKQLDSIKPSEEASQLQEDSLVEDDQEVSSQTEPANDLTEKSVAPENTEQNSEKNPEKNIEEAPEQSEEVKSKDEVEVEVKTSSDETQTEAIKEAPADESLTSEESKPSESPEESQIAVEESQNPEAENDSEEEEVITGDLLAEFSKQLEPEMNAQVEETEKQAQESADSDDAVINTEKMMQEMEELQSLPDDEASIAALEEDTDIEKMATEATKLSND